MLARCFVIQLWKDVLTSKEHCKRTFGKEGDSPSEYLHIKEENIQTEHIVLLKPTITFSYTLRRQWSKIPILARHMILSSAMSQTHLKTSESCLVLHHTATGMSVPLVCDEGHLEQGGDVEHANEESDGDGVHLAEEEDEGGGEGAGQGE